MATPIEKTRAARLFQQRKNRPAGQDQSPAETGASKSIILISGLFVLMIAIGADVLDWLGVGSIPLLGDIIIDVPVSLVIIAWAFLTGAQSPSLLLLIIEYIPVIGDLFPTYILTVLLIIFYNLTPEGAKKIVQKFKPI